MKKATFAMGCFWKPQLLFDKVEGVTKTTVGYTGGMVEDPTYEQVCSDRTGHAEAVEVEYDPDVVSYDDLLKVFWDNHDPTQQDRQGPDVGSQYRSAIFYHDEEQRKLAEQGKKREQEKRAEPIATVIEPAKLFYPAEEYHQKYLIKRGRNTC